MGKSGAGRGFEEHLTRATSGPEAENAKVTNHHRVRRKAEALAGAGRIGFGRIEG